MKIQSFITEEYSPYAYQCGDKFLIDDCLLVAMKDGEYYSPIEPIEIIWKHSVAFRECKNGVLVWFYYPPEQLWYGWKLLFSLEKRKWCANLEADFVSKTPVNSWEFYKDPIFTGVSLEAFVRLVCRVFRVSYHNKLNLKQIAEIIGATPYYPNCGCARIGVLPTPKNQWAWVYSTISGRNLIWIDGTVYTRGMRESTFFLEDIEYALGEKAERGDCPEWLDDALTLAIWVQRNYYGEEADNNKYFFEAVNRRPSEVYAFKDSVEMPTKSYEFASQICSESEFAESLAKCNAARKILFQFLL